MARLWEKIGITQETGEPYCTNCDYSLSGLTNSSKCPECGKPLVEVLGRRGTVALKGGRRFTSRARLFGIPVIHIAQGPFGDETTGRARGLIAIGDIATGVVAIGGMARGVIAFGGLAIGGIACGGGALGVLGIGGFGAGVLATGGAAVGIFASGGGAAGIVAQGGGAMGYIARGGSVRAVHESTGSPSDPAHATAIFDALSWFFGVWPQVQGAMYWLMAGAVIAAVATSAFILLAAGVRYRSFAEALSSEEAGSGR